MTVHDVDRSHLLDEITLKDGAVVTLEQLLRTVWDDGYLCGYEDGESDIKVPETKGVPF